MQLTQQEEIKVLDEVGRMDLNTGLEYKYSGVSHWPLKARLYVTVRNATFAYGI